MPTTSYLIPDLSWNVAEKSSEEYRKAEITERYFNDIFKLFLRKLVQLDKSVTATDEDKRVLRKLLEELIETKSDF